MQFVDNIGPDQHAHWSCQFTESMDTVVYVDKKRMPRSVCMDAHVDLDFGCSDDIRTLFLNWCLANFKDIFCINTTISL